jgi:hypothetical protein
MSSFTEKFQAGESYKDTSKEDPSSLLDNPEKLVADLMKDFAGVRSQASPADLLALVKQLLSKGQPLDDKKG